MIVVLDVKPGDREIYRVPDDDGLDMRMRLADRAREVIMETMVVGGGASVVVTAADEQDFVLYHPDAVRTEVPR